MPDPFYTKPTETSDLANPGRGRRIDKRHHGERICVRLGQARGGMLSVASEYLFELNAEPG